MAKFGWIGSLTALIMPAAANAFGIFWMRQYIQRRHPRRTARRRPHRRRGFFRQYWHVALPVVRPGLAFLGIFTFIAPGTTTPGR